MDYATEQGMPIDTFCMYVDDDDQDVWLKKGKTDNRAILTTGWPDAVKAYGIQENTICVFGFIVEFNKLCLSITPL